MLNTNVLVLNHSFLPIHVTSVRRAICLVYQGGARAVDGSYQTFDFDGWRIARARLRGTEEGEGDVLGTPSGSFPVPRVIVLLHFDRVPRRHVRFSRLNIFARDRYTCQYCEQRLHRSQLNLDHVVPRTQGGRTTWENVVCCCVPCNRRKGGRTPEQAGLELTRKPARPRWSPLMNMAPSSIRYREWRPFLINGESSYGSL